MKSPGCAIFLGIAVAVCCGAPAWSAPIRSLPGKHGVIIQIWTYAWRESLCKQDKL
jgi:hypothetical protein